MRCSFCGGGLQVDAPGQAGVCICSALCAASEARSFVASAEVCCLQVVWTKCVGNVMGMLILYESSEVLGFGLCGVYAV